MIPVWSDDHVQALEQTIKTLRAERDEARREVCLTWESVMGREAQTVAEDKGWDCFKEEDA
jgi:hypothetical protein